MKQSPLNLKPIVCKPSEAAVIVWKAIREYLKNETRNGKYTGTQRRGR